MEGVWLGYFNDSHCFTVIVGRCGTLKARSGGVDPSLSSQVQQLQKHPLM